MEPIIAKIQQGNFESSFGTFKFNISQDDVIQWNHGVERKHLDCVELILNAVIGPALAENKKMAEFFKREKIVGIWASSDKMIASVN